MHQSLPSLLPMELFKKIFFAASFRIEESSTDPKVILNSASHPAVAYCFFLLPLRFITSPKLVLKDPFNYNRENPNDYVHIPHQILVLRLLLMCCSLTYRVLSSRRRSVSSVSPPSQIGRLSVTMCASRLTTIRRKMLGCCWSLSASRLTLPRLVGWWRAYILMELRSTMVSRDKVLAICYNQ